MKPDAVWNFLRVKAGDFDQTIELVRARRHFGGWQWYCLCPVTNRRVSVLWKPARREPLLQPADLGQTGGLFLPVSRHFRPHLASKI